MNRLDEKLNSTQEKSPEASGNKQALGVIAGVVAVLGAGIYFSIVAVDKHLEQADEAVTQDPVTSENIVTRDNFKDRLTDFERDIQPILNNTESSEWDRKAHSQAVAFKNEALGFYSSGQYSSAVKALGESESTALSLEERWNSDYVENYSLAFEYFKSGDSNRALLNNTKALKIKPSSKEANELSQRIEVFPQVSKLLRQFDIAKKENDTHKQIRVIDDILTLDSKREELVTLKQGLQTKLQEIAYQNHIDKAFETIERQDFEVAVNHYRKAKAIYSNRSEIQLLAQKLDTVELDSKLERVHLEIDRLVASDDWESLMAMVTDAEAYFPTDAKLTDAKQLATKIISLKFKAKQFTSRPNRIRDANIRSHAKTFIREAIRYTSYSQSLSDDVGIISNAMKAATTSYPLTIFSDDRTDITIKRVGIVGATKEKTVMLAPGRYQVEGKRRGYKTVLQTIEINNSDNHEITVVCNEQV